MVYTCTNPNCADHQVSKQAIAKIERAQTRAQRDQEDQQQAVILK